MALAPFSFDLLIFPSQGNSDGPESCAQKESAFPFPHTTPPNLSGSFRPGAASTLPRSPFRGRKRRQQKALEEHYGRPGAAQGTSACPQLRLLTLVETGTRAVIAAAFGPYRTAETALVRHVLPQLRPGMLCLADRGFSGRALWRQAAGTGADLLWRVRGDRILPCLKALPDGSYLSALYASARHRRQDRGGIRVRVIDYRLAGVADAEPMYRLVTTLLDPTSAPAVELAALYHERWQAEIVLGEIKVTLPGQHLILRSRRPDLVEQEVYGLLLAHFALRQLMLQASAQAGCDPDTLSFLHAVQVVRRHLPLHGALSPSPGPPAGHAHPG